MENKYYTPSLEDFYYGYEYEIMVPPGIWKTGKFPEWLENRSELREFDGDLYMKVAHAIIRTKFLDKSDIESFGFESKWNDSQSECFQKKPWFITKFHEYENNIQINKGDYVYFRGKIPSKNELLKIMKLLGIWSGQEK